MSYRFTISAAHVACPKPFAGPKSTTIQREAAEARSAIGPLQQCDIGKRVFRNGGVTQVENNEQMNRRLGNA